MGILDQYVQGKQSEASNIASGVQAGKDISALALGAVGAGMGGFKGISAEASTGAKLKNTAAQMMVRTGASALGGGFGTIAQSVQNFNQSVIDKQDKLNAVNAKAENAKKSAEARWVEFKKRVDYQEEARLDRMEAQKAKEDTARAADIIASGEKKKIQMLMRDFGAFQKRKDNANRSLFDNLERFKDARGIDLSEYFIEPEEEDKEE